MSFKINLIFRIKPFLTFLTPGLTYANFEFVFHNTASNPLHVIYLYNFKKCQNFQAKNKLKEFILAKMSSFS